MQNNDSPKPAPVAELEVHAAMPASPYFSDPVSLPKEARSWSL
jgi:hypothetical protein